MSTEAETGVDQDNVMEESLDVSGSESAEKKLARSERKRQFYVELMAKKKEDRKRKKLERKIRVKEEEREMRYKNEDRDNEAIDRKSKKERKEEVKQKLEEAQRTGQKICIDCSLEEFMSQKEIGKLAMQIGRLYGSNRKADNPAHLYLTGLQREGTLFQECVKKNDGFLNYMMDLEEKPHAELFPVDKMVYLSPDSDKALSDIDPECVYVIGGLVDESVTKNISQSRADGAGICTARLPIDEHMEKVEQSSYSKVLSVNQVFDILLTYLSTKSWRAALQAGVPRRKGYIVKPEETEADSEGQSLLKSHLYR